MCTKVTSGQIRFEDKVANKNFNVDYSWKYRQSRKNCVAQRTTRLMNNLDNRNVWF